MQKDLIEGLRTLRRGEPKDGYRDVREVFRIRCHYEVEFGASEHRNHGQIVDIGLGGMKLRCAHPPEVGESVNVSYPTVGDQVANQSVPCRVEWVRGREKDSAQFVGLTYDASNELLGCSWVKVLLKELGFRPDLTFQRRRFLRAEGFIPVCVTDCSGTQHDGQLCNLGVQGALVENPLPYPLGSELTLEIGPLENLQPLKVTGTVTQTSSQSDLLSISFTQLTRESTDTLGSYLRHLLLNHWE